MCVVHTCHLSMSVWQRALPRHSRRPLQGLTPREKSDPRLDLQPRRSTHTVIEHFQRKGVCVCARVCMSECVSEREVERPGSQRGTDLSLQDDCEWGRHASNFQISFC